MPRLVGRALFHLSRTIVKKDDETAQKINPQKGRVVGVRVAMSREGSGGPKTGGRDNCSQAPISSSFLGKEIREK